MGRLLFLFLCFVQTSVLSAKVIYVRTDADDQNNGLSWQSAKRTILSAIAASANGDQIWIKAGNYDQALTLAKSISIYGGFAGTETSVDQRDLAHNQTAVGSTGITLNIGGQLQQGIVIDGITFTQLGATAGQVIVSNAGPLEIRNCVFTGITLTSNSMCIHSEVTPKYTNCLFNNNHVPTLISSDNLTVTGTIFQNNVATGGIQVPGSCGFSYCTFIDNSIYLTLNFNNSGQTVLDNDVFARNSISGAKPLVLLGGTIRATNDTFVNNACDTYGVLSVGTNPGLLANNIFASNLSGIVAGVASGRTIKNNCFYNNFMFDAQGIPSPVGSDNNINLDPQFGDRIHGNYHIQPSSPCVNAGDNGSVTGATDFEGQPRIQGGTIDIGADESDGTDWIPVLPTIYHVSPSGSDANDGLSWLTAKNSISSALSAAVYGDQIWIAEGTYREQVSMKDGVDIYGGFEGTETAIDSRDIANHPSVIDGEKTRTCVIAPIRTVAVTRLDGVTVANGGGGQGGGLYGTNAALEIANCSFIQNTSTNTGGGLELDKSVARIQSCLFASNVAAKNGGGAYFGSSWLSCDHCSFTSNASTGGYGGGIYFTGSLLTVARCQFMSNEAQQGGGLNAGPSDKSSTIRFCVFDRNDAQNFGGALSASGGFSLDNNTFVSNTAQNGGAANCTGMQITNNRFSNNGASTGGALFILGGSVVNNTIVQNSAAIGGACYEYSSGANLQNNIICYNHPGIAASANGTYTNVKSNCIFGNEVYDVSGFDNPIGANGNFSADPQLATPFGPNLHIQSTSPCVDAGAIPSINIGDFDMDNQSRLIGAAYDIGADESDGTVWPPYMKKIQHVSPTGNDSNTGVSWAEAKQTVSAALTAVAAGDEVWIAEGTYPERITIPAGIKMYGGFAGAETTVAERKLDEHPTILDGQMSGTVVTFAPGATLQTVFDGLRIISGTGINGAGILALYGSEHISNCHVSGCIATNNGGGAYIGAGSPILEENVFESNAGYGADVRLSNSSAQLTSNAFRSKSGSQVELYGCNSTIANNRFENSPHIYIDSSSTISVTENVLVGKGSGISSDGGGLISGNYVLGSGVGGQSRNLTIEHNVVENGSGIHVVNGLVRYNRVANCSSDKGGGISIENGVAVGNILQWNAARTAGGNIYVKGTSTVESNTLVGGYAPLGGGAYVETNNSDFSNNIVALGNSGIDASGTQNAAKYNNNCFFGNKLYDFSELYSGIVTKNGNIIADPKFANWGGYDLHLNWDSPCRDAGNNNKILNLTTDYDGQPRIQPTGGTVDIGADESDGSAWPPYLAKVIRVAPNGTDDNDGLSWDHAKATISAALATSQYGDQVWVMSGTYRENIALKQGVGLYGGFDGVENFLQDRARAQDPTSVIDGGANPGISVARILPCSLDNTILDGFVLENGSSDYGGGLLCNYTDARIDGNLIASNAASRSGGGVYAVPFGGLFAANRVTNNSLTHSTGYTAAVFQGNCVIASNLFYGNHDPFAGHVSMTDGLFIGNTVTRNATMFGGYALGCGGTANIIDNIIAFNTYGVSEAGSNAYFVNDCIYGNGSQDFNPAANDPNGQNGNIRVDPQFIDRQNNDYHLTPGSPCIDVGDVYYGWNYGLDLSGSPRINGKGIDMGCYEVVSTLISGRISFGQLRGSPPRQIDVLLRSAVTGDDWALYRANVGSDGSYAVPAPRTPLILGVRAGNWLQRNVMVDTTVGSKENVNPALINGDANRDNQVDLKDIGLVFEEFGGDAGPADLNRDNHVDLRDLAITFLNFGQVGDT